MSFQSNGRVLVLGSDTRSFLTVVRSLGRKGIEVHIAWCHPDSPARHSRYVSMIHDIPRFANRDGRWKERLSAILQDWKYDLVIPCDDPSIIPLQMNRDEFDRMARLYLLDDRVFEVTYDKLKSTELAEELGIPVPSWTLVSSENDLEVLPSSHSFPVVLKPLSSFKAENLAHRREVVKAFSLREMERAARAMLQEGPMMVQEHFNGVGCGVEFIADGGEILSVFQHVRVHEPLHGGGGSYRKSIPPIPSQQQAAAKLIRHLKYTGVGMIEFKMDPGTQQWVFMEMNARFWGSLPLAVASGIDFPWYLYQLMVMGRRDFNREYRKGLYCRNLVADIEWFRANARADHSDPHLHTVPLRQVAAELTNIIALREKSDTLVLDDPLPAFADVGYWLRDKCRGLATKLHLKLGTLRLWKFFSRRAAARACIGKRTIVFVCTGNICRSPFAAYHARRLMGDGIECISAGFAATEGRISPPEALAAARHLGVDMSRHEAMSISSQMLEEAGVVFVFDTLGYRALHDRYPAVRPRLFYLGAFLAEGPLEISDPYGRPESEFEKTYRSIGEATSTLARSVRAFSS